MLFVTMGALPVSAQTFDEAVAAYKLGDFATALRGFRSYVEQSDASAQLNLGVMYANGQGVPEDTMNAYAWFSIAAARGNTSAKEFKELVTRTDGPVPDRRGTETFSRVLDPLRPTFPVARLNTSYGLWGPLRQNPYR